MKREEYFEIVYEALGMNRLDLVTIGRYAQMKKNVLRSFTDVIIVLNAVLFHLTVNQTN
jgi:hypothetical protein